MRAQALAVVRSYDNDQIVEQLLGAQYSNQLSQGGIGSDHGTII